MFGEVALRLGGAMPFEIAARRTGEDACLEQKLCMKAIAVRVSEPDRDIHYFADEVADSIAREYLDVQIRISIQKIVDARREDIVAECTIDIDAAPTADLCFGPARRRGGFLYA